MFLGYTFTDTITVAIQEALKGKFDYIVHHFLIVALVLNATYIPDGNIARWIPHLLLCDTTNIFFNAAWLFRTTPLKDSSIVFTLEILFAISFFFIRVIHLPIFLLVCLSKPYMGSFGWAKFALGPFVLLQW